jgi:TRAP transporter T-component
MKIKLFVIIVLPFVLFSCSSLIQGLTDALYQEKDLKLVQDGAPSYLLLIEGFINSNPTDKNNLVLGIQLFGAYSSAFVKDEARGKIFAEKSKTWALMLLRTYPFFKSNEKKPFDIYDKAINAFGKRDVNYIFWAANAWIMWIVSNADNPDALIELPKAKALIDKIYKLDDTFYFGAPHLFYGLFYSFIPKEIGGDLNKAKEEFDKAFMISKGKILSMKVAYAMYYCKAKYDKDEFKKTLTEVINTDIDKYPDQRLLNAFAQKEAKELLDKIDDLF